MAGKGGAEVGSAYVSIVPKMKDGLMKEVAEKMERNGNEGGARFLAGFQSGAGAIATAAVTIGATAAASLAAAGASLVKMSVESFSAYEQLSGGVDTLFRDASQQVKQYAAEAYSTAQISANDYMQQISGFSASLVQSLGGDYAAAAEYGNMAIIDMSDNANKMGTAIESIQYAYQGFAKQNFTMLDNLKLGYGGTKSEMERLLEDAEAIKAKNGEMVDYSIDSFADMVEAIHVVQEEMGIAGASADEASTTIEGSVNQMKASWQNFLVALATGENVEDATDQLVESVRIAVGNIIPVVEEILSNIWPATLEIAAEIDPDFAAALEEIGDAAADFFASIGDTLEIESFGDLLGKVADGIEDIDVEEWKDWAESIIAIGDALTKPIQLLEDLYGWLKEVDAKFVEMNGGEEFDIGWAAVDLVSGNVANKQEGAGRNAASSFGKDSAFVPSGEQSQAWLDFKESVSQAVDGIFESFSELGDGIQSAFSFMRDGASDAFTGIVEGASGVPDAVAGFFSGIGEGIASRFDEMRGGVSSRFNSVVEGVRGVPGRITGFFSGIGSRVSGFFSSIPSSVAGVFSRMVGHIRGIPGQIVGFFIGLGSRITSAFGHIKLPHFSLTTSSREVLGQTLTYPTGFNVSWYAEGAIFDPGKPVVYPGFGDNGTYQEAAIPLSPKNLAGIGEGVAANMRGGYSSDAVVAWLDANLGAVIAAYAPAATPREFGRMVRSCSGA